MNAGGSAGPGKAPACVPTWRGHIETTKDALLVFQGCFDGTLSHCFRRPHDRERNQLIVSGNVFVYEEATSGIKRWTDGIPWSPSRILTNFLIYRQLNSPFPPGEKKRATKRSQRPLKPGEPYPSSGSASGTPTTDKHDSSFATPGSPTPSTKKEDSPDKDSNRGLVGSLVDSYEFKENGLLKKTMTVTVQNVQHHLVSYYSLDDAKFKLKTPREDPRLKDLQVGEKLIQQPKFKFPNLDDAGDGSFDQMEGSPIAYPSYYHNGYDPSRVYQTPQHMPYPVSQAYPYAGAYAPSHPPPAGASYAHMPPTTGSYQPIAASAHYPQHQSHAQYYQQHGQHVPQYQGQPQQSPQYPPQHYQQMQPHTPGQVRHPGTKSESVPRTNGSYDYPSHAEAHAEPGPTVYSAGAASAAPQGENPLPMVQPQQAQTWPMGYSQQQQQQHQHQHQHQHQQGPPPQPPPPPQQQWGSRPDDGPYAYRPHS